MDVHALETANLVQVCLQIVVLWILLLAFTARPRQSDHKVHTSLWSNLISRPCDGSCAVPYYRSGGISSPVAYSLAGVGMCYYYA
jgi:hypothetical protein